VPLWRIPLHRVKSANAKRRPKRASPPETG
jgi:hypothetical protein